MHRTTSRAFSLRMWVCCRGNLFRKVETVESFLFRHSKILNESRRVRRVVDYEAWRLTCLPTVTEVLDIQRHTGSEFRLNKNIHYFSINYVHTNASPTECKCNKFDCVMIKHLICINIRYACTCSCTNITLAQLNNIRSIFVTTFVYIYVKYIVNVEHSSIFA